MLSPNPFEPVGVERRYPPPKASISPDRSVGWLRRIAPVVLAHKWWFFGSIAIAIIALLCQVAIPAVLKEAIDTALTDKSQSLGRYVWMLAGLGIARGALTGMYRYGLFRVAHHIDADMRGLLYEHLSELSWSYFDRTQAGQVISRANSDIRSVQMFLTFAPLLSMTALMFVVALVYMLSIHVTLTLVAVLPLPGVFFLGMRLRNEVFPLSWIVQSRLANVATIVDENVNGVRVVKSFAAERNQITQLAKAATELRWASVRTIDARARHNPIIENLPRLGQALVLLYGGWLAIDGVVSTGTLFLFTTYVTLLQVPFRTLGMLLMLGQRAKASAGRIYEVLDEQPEIVDRLGAIDLVDIEGNVSFQGVTFAYNSHGADAPDGDADDDDGAASSAWLPTESTRAPSMTNGEAVDAVDATPQPDEPRERPTVLDGFDLDVPAGQTVAIVGRTGSGKSTVARLLGRFYEPTTGRIAVDGHAIGDLTRRSLRSHIGLVADEPFLFSVSLRDNIAYGAPTAELDEIVAAAKAAQAHDFISALPEGYDTVVGERGYTLSGGQRQRIALARALLVNPQILVLDDATSAIDVRVEEAIHDALTTRLVGRTTIVIAHRLSTIALADRVVVLDGGAIVADGTHTELMATVPLYAEILASTDNVEPDDIDTDLPIGDAGTKETAS